MIYVVLVFAQGNDFMVPFSPDRPSTAPADGGAENPTMGTSEVTAVTSDIAHVLALNVEIGEASTAAKPSPTGTTASTPGDSSVAGGVGGSGSGMKEFCFSDDDDTEGEELQDKELDNIKPKGDSGSGGMDDGQGENERGESKPTGAAGTTADSIAKIVGGDGTEEGQKQAQPGRGRRQRTKDGGGGDGSDDLSSGSDNGGGSVSVGEGKRRQDHLEALLNPLGLPQGGRTEGDGSGGNRTPPAAGKRGTVDSACATPAPGACVAPDFGFSSDDDFDIEFSASERSLERSVERSWSRSPRAKEEEARN